MSNSPAADAMRCTTLSSSPCTQLAPISRAAPSNGNKRFGLNQLIFHSSEMQSMIVCHDDSFEFNEEKLYNVEPIIQNRCWISLRNCLSGLLNC